MENFQKQSSFSVIVVNREVLSFRRSTEWIETFASNLQVTRIVIGLIYLSFMVAKGGVGNWSKEGLVTEKKRPEDVV